MTQEKPKNNFAGALGGKNYAMCIEAYTHFDTFQDTIANEIAKRGDNLHILEIGCGPGTTTIKLLDKNPTSTICALDLEKQMIDEAKINLAKYSNRLQLIQADVLEYLAEVEDNTLEIVTSGWTLHNFPVDMRQKVLSEIYRVLKPKGLFINGDKYAQENPKLRKEAYEWSLQRFRTVGQKYDEKAWTQEWMDHMAFDETPEIVMFENKAKDNMDSIGFKKIETIYREKMEAVLVAEK